MSIQNALSDNAVGKSLLAVDGETDAETRRIHTLTAGAVNGVAVAILDGAGAQITSFGGGTQYADGAARGTATGTIAMGDDGTNIQSLHCDSSGDLQIDVLTMPTVAVTGTFWQATQPVSATDLDIRNLTNVDVVTAELSAVDNAVLDAIAASVDGIEALIGTTNTNTAAATTALQIMDDWDNGASDGASVSGDVAHDSADAGEPVKVGFKAVLFDKSAPPNAAVAENDRVNGIADEYGRQYINDVHPNFWDVSVDYASAQTNASVKAAPGAGLSLYITDISISNGAVAGNITLLDGSGGTVKYEIYPAINGGAVHALRTPIKLTANTALCVTSTTVTTFSVNVTGFIAP